ncbi:heme-binding protein [Aeoliella sp. SH292]|uniref:heme-binding protein n=1 Tax=Aeoliella sp. SH292 TaxID=3454464 RepID=UPI003F97A11F
MFVRSLAVFGLGLALAPVFCGAEEVEDKPATTGKVIERLGGEAKVDELPQDDGTVFYRSGEYRVITPLPVGYPAPTPPKVVEVKSYPEVRRATFDGKGAAPDGMKNSSTAFFPLFGHIKSRGIAMTAPVEIEYEGLESGDEGKISGWNMSFLYRDKSDGPTQSYANITVEDAKPVTVVATGIAGDVTREKIDAALKVLHESLEESTEWQVAGDPRVLGYNGPDIKESLRWGEVQLPVERVDAQEE